MDSGFGYPAFFLPFSASFEELANVNRKTLASQTHTHTHTNSPQIHRFLPCSVLVYSSPIAGIANTAVVSSNPANMVISSTSASPFSSVKGSNGLKAKSGVQQMDIDDSSTISPNPNHLPSPKYALGMDSKLINKVKIVVDNMNGGGSLANKHRLDLDANCKNKSPQNNL